MSLQVTLFCTANTINGMTGHTYTSLYYHLYRFHVMIADYARSGHYYLDRNHYAIEITLTSCMPNELQSLMSVCILNLLFPAGIQ